MTDKVTITPAQPLAEGDTVVIAGAGKTSGTYLVRLDDGSYRTLEKTNRAIRRAAASRRRKGKRT